MLLNERPLMAKKFYAVIAFSMLVGMSLDYVGINAIKMHFWASVANGLLAPPLVVIILRVCNDRRVMGEHKNGRLLNVAGVFAAVVMSAAALAALVAWWTR